MPGVDEYTKDTPVHYEEMNKRQNQLMDAIDDIEPYSPFNTPNYNAEIPWIDILIPDADRGNDLLEFLESYEDTAEQINSSEGAMHVIMNEEDYNKTREIPDFEEHILKLDDTPCGQSLAWIEQLLAKYDVGQNRLDLAYEYENTAEDVSGDKYAMRVINDGEEFDGLKDYRVEESA